MAIDELAPGSSHERQARARPQGERMTILGIDPGKSGAIAVLDEGGELLKVHDTPSTLEPNGRSASIAVEVGGVVHLEHYSTRNGTIRVTYGSSRKSTQSKSTQIGGMSSAPGVLARIMLAELAREALGIVEGED